MEIILSILLSCCIVLMILGIFNPNISLFFITQKEKITRKKSTFIYFSLLLFIWFLLVVFQSDENKISNEKQSETISELLYQKDIDIDTGDTIYKTSIFAKTGYVPYYSKNNINPEAILTFQKNNKNIQSSIYLTLGEFIKGDTIDIYFSGQNPEIKATYYLKSKNEAILKIKNCEAFMKKLNMRTYFFIHIPIPKQNGKTSFYSIYKEGKVTFESKNYK